MELRWSDIYYAIIYVIAIDYACKMETREELYSDISDDDIVVAKPRPQPEVEKDIHSQCIITTCVCMIQSM